MGLKNQAFHGVLSALSLKFQKPAAWEQEFQLYCQGVAFVQYAYTLAVGTYTTENSFNWTCKFSKEASAREHTSVPSQIL